MTWMPAGPAAPDDRSVGPRRLEGPLGGILVLAVAGAWYAVEDRCSHAGCAFTTDGEIADGRAVCDCHGSEFDVRTGEVLVGPATRPIATFPVRVVDGRLEVEA